MEEYDELIAEVKSALANNTDIDVKAKDIDDLSSEQIKGIQQVINDYSIDYINKSLEKGLIDNEAADYLRGIYFDAMETYRSLYKNITDTLLKTYRPHRLQKLEELGEEPAPEEINSINLETGEVEINEEITGFHNNTSRYKEYRPGHITPFTNMRLTFYDLRDNPIYVIMPGLKNVRRAIDKIKMPVIDKKTGKVLEPGGKYYQQYIKDMDALQKKCGTDKALFEKSLVNIAKPHQRLKDVVRFTITRKYYMDTEETLNIFSKDPRYGIDSKETKDSFNANSSRCEDYDTKNYRDKKIFLHMSIGHNSFVVETQVKITKLYEGDIDTHKIYAGDDATVADDENSIFITKKNTANRGLRYWEEGLKRFKNEADRVLANMHIFRLRMSIQKRNKEAIRAYNLQVIDKAFRIEDAKLANGKDFDASCHNSKNGKDEKIFSGVADFIANNFIYRPFKAYDRSAAFNPSDEELRSLGGLASEDQIFEFTERYSQFIIPKYNGVIEGNEAVYFKEQSQRPIIEAQFSADAYNERPLASVIPEQDEIDAMKERGFAFDEDKEDYPHKRLDNKNRNKHNNKQKNEGLDSFSYRAQSRLAAR